SLSTSGWFPAAVARPLGPSPHLPCAAAPSPLHSSAVFGVPSPQSARPFPPRSPAARLRNDSPQPVQPSAPAVPCETPCPRNTNPAVAPCTAQYRPGAVAPPSAVGNTPVPLWSLSGFPSPQTPDPH